MNPLPGIVGIRYGGSKPSILFEIFSGDCLDLMKEIPDKCVDLVLTDPPYGIGIAHNPIRQKHEKKD